MSSAASAPVPSTFPPSRQVIDTLLDEWLGDAGDYRTAWRSATTEVPMTWLMKWFGACSPESKAAIDAASWRYHDLVEAAIAAGPQAVQDAAVDPDSALALTLLLDQFPRNCHRTTETKSSIFQRSDPIALALVKNKVFPKGWDVDPSLGGKGNTLTRVFFVLPLEHSEAREDSVESKRRLQEMFDDATEQRKEMAQGGVTSGGHHYELIQRFGRYPHRNEALGRKDTPEEAKWRKETGGNPFG